MIRRGERHLMSLKTHPTHVDTQFVEQLLYGISHDLGAPFRHVAQFSALLQDSASERLEEKEVRWLTMINQSAIKTQDLLKSLVGLSRLSTRLGEPSTIKLKSLLDDTLQRHKAQIISAKAEIHSSKHWPDMLGYQEHWETLLSCLIQNSLTFHKKDTNPQINIYCLDNERELELTIEDNGIGIVESQRKYVTRPFKKLNHPDDYPGIGVGLTYCAYIAQLNMATLAFHESSLGGLKVIFSIPKLNFIPGQ